MTKNAIEIYNLTKKFGDFTAADNLSLNVKEGEIFGFLGPNGAGKSTTIRVLCTLAQPTSGSAKIAGFDLVKDSAKVRENIELVAEKMIMYDRLTAAENLRFFGKLYNMPKQRLEKRIDDVLELVDMQKWKNTQISKFFHWYETANQRCKGAHHVTSDHIIDFDGDTARLRANMTAMYLWSDEESDPRSLQTHFIAGGVFEAVVVRGADGWRFNELKPRITWRTGAGHVRSGQIS